jgi:hypothetical protein
MYVFLIIAFFSKFWVISMHLKGWLFLLVSFFWRRLLVHGLESWHYIKHVVNSLKAMDCLCVWCLKFYEFYKLINSSDTKFQKIGILWFSIIFQRFLIYKIIEFIIFCMVVLEQFQWSRISIWVVFCNLLYVSYSIDKNLRGIGILVVFYNLL